ncbi:MAG TPA: hypothetical protein VHA34_05250 [Actinomycetes bacterium]|nr:hypothetical protein [Actinomycetes bacterium]
MALAVCLNPLRLPYLWQDANDALLVAGTAAAAPGGPPPPPWRRRR